jgi:hypothetical protein
MPALKPLVLAALLATSAAVAQEHPGKLPVKEAAQPSPTATPVMPQPPRPDVGPVLTIDFPGGTVGQYIEALRHASSQPVNIVVPPRASKANMAPVSLKTVSLIDALGAVLAVADIPADEDWGVRPLWQISSMGVSPATAGGDSVPGFAILVQTRSRSVITPAGPQFMGAPHNPRTTVYSIRALLDSGMKPEAVITAIGAVLSMDKQAEAPEIKFHEESGLLILRATPEQTDSAEQVIARLQETAKIGARDRSIEERRKKMEDLSREVEGLYQTAQGMKSDYYAKKEAVAAAQRDVDKLDAANVPPDQLAKARERAGAVQREVVAAGFRVDTIEREIRSRERALEQLRSMDSGAGGADNAEIARLRAENAELRARLERLEEKKDR